MYRHQNLWLYHAYKSRYDYIKDMVAIMAAILDLNSNQDLYMWDKCFHRFVDPEKLCIHTKIMTVPCLQVEIWPYIRYGGHIGGHLGFS